MLCILFINTIYKIINIYMSQSWLQFRRISNLLRQLPNYVFAYPRSPFQSCFGINTIQHFVSTNWKFRFNPVHSFESFRQIVIWIFAYGTWQWISLQSCIGANTIWNKFEVSSKFIKASGRFAPKNLKVFKFAELNVNSPQINFNLFFSNLSS